MKLEKRWFTLSFREEQVRGTHDGKWGNSLRGFAFLYHIWMHWSKFGTVQPVLSRVAYYRRGKAKAKAKPPIILLHRISNPGSLVLSPLFNISMYIYKIVDTWFCQDLCTKKPLLLWAKDTMNVTFLTCVSNKMRCSFYRYQLAICTNRYIKERTANY